MQLIASELIHYHGYSQPPWKAHARYIHITPNLNGLLIIPRICFQTFRLLDIALDQIVNVFLLSCDSNTRYSAILPPDVFYYPIVIKSQMSLGAAGDAANLVVLFAR